MTVDDIKDIIKDNLTIHTVVDTVEGGITVSVKLYFDGETISHDSDYIALPTCQC